MLSEKKAINSLKPWWDVAFHYSLLALISLALLMLLVTSGFGQGQYLSITNENPEDNGSNKIIRTTRIRKNGQIDVVFKSRFITDDRSSGGSLSNLNKSGGIIDEIQEGVDERSRESDYVAETRESNAKLIRMKRSSSAISPSMDFNMSSGTVAKDLDDPVRNHDVVNAIYTIVIFFVIFLFEIGGNKVFYSDHLMQSLVHLTSTLSDIREFNKTQHGLIFANTLHHAYNRSSLWTLFWMKNFFRTILIIVALSITAHFHLTDVSAYGTSGIEHTRFSIGILMIMLVIGNLCLSLYGLIWPWFVSISSWGQLMQKYSDSLNKIDVARGRCVPMPSSVAHSSRFSLMASPLQMLTQSNVISKKVSAKTSIERIVDALNPYTASPNIRLILDMVAYKSGIGVALRILAFLEIDVHNNWRPFRPQLKFIQDNSEITLEISWKDPLSILYLNPVPNELQLHYGIEIYYGVNMEDCDKLVEIVGYQETRYFRQIWHYQHRGSVSSNLEGSTLTLCQGDMESQAEPFVYKESFSNILPPKSNEILKVIVWTIIDGQLIAKSSVNYLKDDETRKLSTPPKPPRMLPKEEDTNLTTSSAPGSKNDDDISNDEVMNQASPIITPISDDKPFNIQCSTINESKISVTKPERTIPPIPQRIAANRNDDQDQHCYNNKTSRCRKSFIQSRAKSLTSLKNEIRRSFKRRHRLSGEHLEGVLGQLKKSKSVGNKLPFKSRDDFCTFRAAREKIEIKSTSSNETFESSTEHII